VAQWSPSIGARPERLIAAADEALYAAKDQGRNRFAVHDPAPPLAPEDRTKPSTAPIKTWAS
jgi:predicted signal transduction protein with EAL and GGDEF domain